MALNSDPLHIIKNGTNNEGDTREEYMEKLRKWCNEAHQHNTQLMEAWQNYCMQYQTWQNNVQQQSFRNDTPQNTRGEPAPTFTDSTARYGADYVAFTIPPIWKRFMAEVIDFFILFSMKMFLTLILIENFELLDLENYTFSAFEERLQNPTVVAKLTLEIFVLEILHRIIVCFYEAYWISIEGATPGKRIMKLGVVNVTTIIQPTAVEDFVIASPCTLLTFKDALVRAVLKNVFVGLLFPICFFLLFFKYRRTGYDLLTNSLVVEHNTP